MKRKNKYEEHLDKIRVENPKKAVKDALENFKTAEFKKEPVRDFNQLLSEKNKKVFDEILLEDYQESQIEAELLSRHYIDFVKAAWPILEPETEFISGWHIEAICDVMEAIANEQMTNVIINVPPRSLLADSTPILTTKGWKTHGTLKVGDFVFHPSGKPTRVLEVKPPYVADYIMEFSNGEKIKCNAEHQWTIWNRTGEPKTQTVPTSWFVTKENRWGYTLAKPKKLVSGNRKPRCSYQLPLTSALEFDEKELLIDPYVLGAWLGDGTSTKPCLTYDPKDKIIANKIAEHYQPSVTHIHKDTGIYTTSFAGGEKGGLRGGASKFTVDLKETGVLGRKHIPEIYKQGSIEQRLQLLAGLIDTDGSVTQEERRVHFSTINPILRDDVIELVRGLGWRASVTYIKKSRRKFPNGNFYNTKDAWVIGFSPDLPIPTLLSRKRIDFSPSKRRIGITAVYKTNEVEQGRCITVAASDGLYLAGRLLIPTHNSKSRLANSLFVPWLWTRKPGLRVLSASHGYGLSLKFSREARMILTSDWYQRLWGHRFKFSARDNEIINNYNGYRRITATGGNITGFGGHILIADDLLDARNQNSKIEREKANQWYIHTFSNRIEGDLSRGRRVVIMQRLHDLDLTGALLEMGGYQHVRLPQEYEPDKKCRVFIFDRNTNRKSLLFEDPRTEKGELLQPARHTEEVLAGERVKGTFFWASQQQQDPVPEGGGLIKIAWLEDAYYSEDPIYWYNRCSKIIQSWDMTFKDTDESDYVVGQLWGQLGANIYLIHQVRDRMDFPTVVNQVRKMTYDWPRSQEKLIEDKANGPAVIQTLKNKVQGMIPVNPEGDKQERLAAVSWMIEAKNVHLPNPKIHKDKANWVEITVTELVRFPKAPNDDTVDALSQALLRLQDVPMIPDLAPHGVGRAARFERDWSTEQKAEYKYQPSPWHKNWSAR